MDIVCIVPSSCTEDIFEKLSMCIESLNHSIKRSSLSHQIIVVTSNNNVPNEIEIYLNKNKIKLMRLSSEMNKFSVLNNSVLNIVLSSNEYRKIGAVLFINDDASVADNFFSFLSSYNLDEQIFISPHILNSNGSATDSFGVQYFSSGYAKNSTNLEDKTTLASASCLVATIGSLKRIIQTYGYIFNPLYDYYLEDVELCIRALMVGVSIKKEKNMKAFHFGSTTSGKKSYFSMFNTYKNVIWTILLTWPIGTILKNIGKIILVQLWTIFFSTINYGPKLYFSVILLTIKNIKTILKYRNNTLSRYDLTPSFEDVLNRHAFRTYHGLYIW